METVCWKEPGITFTQVRHGGEGRVIQTLDVLTGNGRAAGWIHAGVVVGRQSQIIRLRIGEPGPSFVDIHFDIQGKRAIAGEVEDWLGYRADVDQITVGE